MTDRKLTVDATTDTAEEAASATVTIHLPNGTDIDVLVDYEGGDYPGIDVRIVRGMDVLKRLEIDV